MDQKTIETIAQNMFLNGYTLNEVRTIFTINGLQYIDDETLEEMNDSADEYFQNSIDKLNDRYKTD